jgi:triacylglycerol lipase
VETLVHKVLPPATFKALRPWPLAIPYKFFDDWHLHRSQPNSPTFTPANAWWLMDAAFLAYAPPEVVVQAFADAEIQADVQPFSGPSTQCYVVSTPEWHVLAFRGTQVDQFWPSVLDWASDFAVVPMQDGQGHWVHRGFSDALDQVWQPVTSYLRTKTAIVPLRPFVITGHSLGAALATLAANRCGSDFGLTACYTFGSPRVGNRGFGEAIDIPVYRVRNNSDVVTDVPHELLLTHVGQLEFIDNNGHLHQDSRDHVDLVHRLLNTEASLVSSLKTQLHVPGILVPGPVADHAPINYAILLWNGL